MHARTHFMLSGFALALSACATTATPPAGSAPADLHALLIRHVDYACGETVASASYYSLSDDSLAFARITLPDGSIRTLPQALSASGARYTDDRYEWWTKGDSAYAKVRSDSGDWVDAFAECVARVTP